MLTTPEGAVCMYSPFTAANRLLSLSPCADTNESKHYPEPPTYSVSIMHRGARELKGNYNLCI